jgi:hypothetical protein
MNGASAPFIIPRLRQTDRFRLTEHAFHPLSPSLFEALPESPLADVLNALAKDSRVTLAQPLQQFHTPRGPEKAGRRRNPDESFCSERIKLLAFAALSLGSSYPSDPWKEVTPTDLRWSLHLMA